MTAWSIITELDDVDDELLALARDALRQAVQDTTGVRPRTKTIRTDAFNAALHPVEPMRQPAEPRWYGSTMRPPT